MTTEKLNIPKVIHVGYVNREDTYTKKLAYVIYTDEKGKKRKETSWQGWRDKAITPEDFDNEPTSGFVLNKGVGGTRGSWSSRNVRNEYIRIYDPRGFEFEISVANLLFILTECNAYKGKGLEGEFVYAWDGTELILLPVGCAEYKTSTEFTALKSMKVTKKDMKEGLTYQHKDTSTMVYMGRHEIREFSGWDRNDTLTKLSDPSITRHVFWHIEDQDWHFEKGFTKLAVIVSEECYADFANLHTTLVSSKYMSKAAKVVLSPITAEDPVIPRSNWDDRDGFFIKVDKGYQLVTIEEKRPIHTYENRYRSAAISAPEGQADDHFWPTQPVIVAEVDEHTIRNMSTGHRNHWGGDSRYAVSKSYLEGKELFTPEIQLESKKQEGVYNYVKRRTNQEVPQNS
tara:strand:- start:2023 stop:3222 length:1200 start_codon:yes stop_codon:yes gene_type:complete